MPATIKPKITDAGLAAAINADSTGVELAITHIALGTGQYDSEATGAGMTAMVNRKEFRAIDGGIVSGTGGCRIMVLFEPWAGSPSTYNATEVGFWAGEPGAPGSILFAVWSHPSEVIVTRNTLNYAATYTLQLVRIPPGSVTIEVNPTAAEAMAIVALHESASDPHQQYVKKAGDTSTGAQFGLTAAPHTYNTQFATTAFVKRQGISFPGSGIMAVTGATAALAVTDLGRIIELAYNGGTCTLPAASDCPAGGAFAFRIVASSANIVAAGADRIMSPTGESLSSMAFAQGESVTLARNANNNWYVVDSGSRQSAGMVSYFSGNTAPPGWLRLDGSILSRASYPALWAYAQSTGGLVSDADWIAGNYFGRYSTGISGSDFRIPDMRGLFLRAHDNGRGFDAGRTWGIYQDHANRAHTHAAATDLQGLHQHGGSTSTAGQHQHDSGWGESNPGFARYGVLGPQNKWGTGSNDMDNWAFLTSPEGNHSHAISTDSAGLHGHNITIYSEGTEARPRNVNWGLFVRFA